MNVAAEMFLLDSQRLLVLCHLISALDPATTRPEPVDAEASWPTPTVIVLSVTSKSVTLCELISPVIFKLPPNVKLPEISALPLISSEVASSSPDIFTPSVFVCSLLELS